MKSFLKSIAVAFSIYSKIPMPHFNWASDDMKYHLCFFPWVGIVIGFFEWGWWLLSRRFGFGELMTVLFGIAIPLLVTGGFHFDGFMDTMDALHSYQPKEKKLEILKDPHIGAFSVICTVIFILLAAGFGSELKTDTAVLSVSFSFVISRCLSGLSVVLFQKAKKDGMLSTSGRTGNNKLTVAALIFHLIFAYCLLAFLTILQNHFLYCVENLLLQSAVFIWYFFMSKKQFGGITGDIAGAFVCISELMAVVGSALFDMICL